MYKLVQSLTVLEKLYFHLLTTASFVTIHPYTPNTMLTLPDLRRPAKILELFSSSVFLDLTPNTKKLHILYSTFSNFQAFPRLILLDVQLIANVVCCVFWV